MEIDAFNKECLGEEEINKKRVLQKIKRDALKKNIFKNDKENFPYEIPYRQWETDKDIKAIRLPYDKEFNDAWKKGFQYYVDGEWTKALNMFSITLVNIIYISRTLLMELKTAHQKF